ncbi:V-set and immunoglobulin domain-containing protein 4 isoform X2 [Dendropsophus ebraccatus]|uniref:V-set and immunoglobulin domain-containing protein 4 isoform X2 n=1 Tax=Dendropsophus ebraccatus TaxID=150705 RepID=UPI0038321AB2
MADSVNIGHSKWLFVLVICFSGRNALCDPTLEMLHNVIGYRSESVKIPCTYTPSEDYEEFRVEWLLWNEEIIYRIESKDNIPLVKFRDRVTISDSPGDVSLTIRKLNFGDKGNIKCKVTWKKNDGTKTTLEKVTVLEVKRNSAESSSEEVIVTAREPDFKRTKPPTEKPKKTTIPTTTHGKPETIEPTTEKPKEHIFTTAHREVLTTNSEPSVNFITTGEPDVTTMNPTTDKSNENIIMTTYRELETTNPKPFEDVITTRKPDSTTIKPTTEKPKENIITTIHQDLQTNKPNRHITTTYQELETTNPESSADFITTGEPDFTTMKPTTAKPNEHIIITTYQELETKEPSSEKPKENLITTIHQEWKAPFSDFSTESVPLYTVIISNAAIPQKKGFSMPLYILIAIIVCIVCVIIVVITLIIKNRRRKGYIYELPTMNQLLALEGGRNQCQSSSDETRASNNYEMCSPSSVAVYEGMLLPFANEYDVLAAENKSENNCS